MVLLFAHFEGEHIPFVGQNPAHSNLKWFLLLLAAISPTNDCWAKIEKNSLAKCIKEHTKPQTNKHVLLLCGALCSIPLLIEMYRKISTVS